MAAPVSAAGIDCRTDTRPAELIVCSSPELLESDGQMAALYDRIQTLVNSNAQARRIRDNQRDWLASRDRCRTIDCLRDIYNERISTLRSVLN